jgi:hypothetical protein
MLTASLKAIFSTTWHFDEDGSRVAELSLPFLSMRNRGTLSVAGGKVYQIEQVGLFRNGFSMKDDEGFVVATAAAPGWFSSGYTIKFNNRELRLKRVWFSVKELFEIRENDIRQGIIFQPKLLSTNICLETSLDIPLEAKLFMLYMGIVVRMMESAGD